MTQDHLEGEGAVRVTVERRVWRECWNCGERAAKRVTYLLDRARSNPASAAYGRDDCTWCADAERHACDSCERQAIDNPPPGHGFCASFTLSRYTHMALEWVTLKPGTRDYLDALGDHAAAAVREAEQRVRAGTWAEAAVVARDSRIVSCGGPDDWTKGVDTAKAVLQGDFQARAERARQGLA